MATEDDQTQQENEPSDTDTLSLKSVWGGLKIHPTLWEPTESPKALLYVCHGVGEYMGRYEELGSHLSQNGVLVFGHDHVGHGRSEGERVHVEDIDTYVQDVIHHVELMKDRYSQRPCILMGHSMGGLIAGHVAIQKPDLFTALILSGTSAELEAKLSIWVVKKMFQLLANVAPQLGVKTLDTNDISSIPEEVERYVNDPLIWHGALKAQWGVAMMSSITLLRENVNRISLPLLLIHGSDDNLVPITSSYFINDNVSSQEKKFEVFEGSRHETLHDKEQERARELIKEWVLSHLTVATAQSDPENPSQSEPEPSAETKQQAQEEALENSEQPKPVEGNTITDTDN